MSNLSAKFASALVLGAVAGAASTALPPSKAHAADNCLQEPRDATPQGKHWYYRIERGTGRKCWYLRGEEEQSADAPSAVPAEKPAPQSADAATSRSIADAHAEIPPRARMPGDAPAPQAAPSVWPNAAAAAPATNPGAANTPAANVAPSPLASRWPQGSDAAPAANPQPEASPMVADATDPDATNAQDSTTQAAPPPSLAAVPAERNTGSIQKLLLVAGGALALAGLTGSAVYRLGRRRKRNDWLRERTNWQSIENPNNPPWVEPVFVHADPDVPDLDEARQTAAHAAATHAFEADETGDRVEKIEEFLARLTEQLHAELESKPRAERDVRAAS
jgi:hypothetical protein